MLRPLLRLASPGARRGRLSILIFHRVLARPDPLFPEEVDAARFDAQCRWLREWFNVLPLDAAARALREGTLPPRAAAITFDDGYADNHDVALPILQRHGLAATFFVATGFLDGGRMWNDTLIESVRRAQGTELRLGDAGLDGITRLPLATPADRRAAIDRLIQACRYLAPEHRAQAVQAVARASGAALDDALMMTSEQVAALHRAGMQIGGHTVSHPILTRLPLPQARREIVDGKARLESIVQAPVTLFAYPNGRPHEDFAADHAALAQEAGFDAAVTTAWGAAHAGSDRYQLPRFTPWDRTRLRFGLRMAHNVGVRPSPARFV
jgi:peptidoglycan/xylan/chitin deacetylase (PgdA/CDA1 family)